MFVLYEQESKYESQTLLGIYPTVELVLQAASYYVANDSWKRARLCNLYYEEFEPNNQPYPSKSINVETTYKELGA